MTTKRHTLDFNKLYGLKLDYNPKTRALTVSVDTQSEPWPRLVENLLSQIRVTTLTKGIGDDKGNKAKRGSDKRSLIFNDIEREFTLKLGDEPIGVYNVEGGQLTSEDTRKLTCSEVRRMGTFYRVGPYSLQQPGMSMEDSRALARKARSAVFTDFHTHSSGQISSRGLINVAIEHDQYYPEYLLKEAGIEVNYQRFPKEVRAEIPRIIFPPREPSGLPPIVDAIKLSALSDAELKILEARMAMPTDRQSTFSEMENDAYQFRYPFTKNKALIADTLMETAKEYAMQGVKYAELAYVNVDDPETLAIIHEAMPRIKAETGVDLRFLASIPRTWPPEQIERSLERIKIMSESPYITGLDFVGYEVNKTKKFGDLLNSFCDWANEHRPGFNIRVHAGENDKNLGNVKDLLQVGINHPNLHFRIGHGVYGMDDEAITLARQLSADPTNPRLTIEPNPSSVVALNNVDDLKQIPYQKMIENGIPFVVSSDSGGTYNTTASQLGLEAMFGGLDSKGFDLLHQHQTHLMQKQLSYSQGLADAIPKFDTIKGAKSFTEGLLEKLKAVPPYVAPKLSDEEKQAQAAEFETRMKQKLKDDEVQLIEANDNVPELDKRKPVTIVGASGESWSRMSPAAQRESAIAVDMLIHALDPKKAYITQGRHKEQGLSDVLRQSIGHANDTQLNNDGEAFFNLGHQAQAKFDAKESYTHLTHLERTKGGLLDFADAIVEHTFKHDGVLVAVGGAAFTRDIILKADQRGMLDDNPTNRKMMLLLQCAEGASAEKARVLNPAYRAAEGKELVAKIFKHYRELLPDGFTKDNLEQLYKESAQRVTEYGFQHMDSVIDLETVQTDRRVEERRAGGRSGSAA